MHRLQVSHRLLSMHIEQTLQRIIDHYGHGLWAMQQVIDDLPEALPEAVAYRAKFSKAGGAISLAAELRKTERIEKVSKLRTGATLWRVKP